MKGECNANGRWNWMNAISGFLAAGFIGLGIVNFVSGRLPHDIAPSPLLPFILSGMLAGAVVGGAAQMEVPASLHALKGIGKPLRWLAVALFVALSIALAVSAIQYQSSHPLPPGWDFLD